MAYKFYNPNPYNQRVGDCAVRAISKVMKKDWEDTYVALCAEGLLYKDMPSANYVWGMYLRKNGYEQTSIPSICPDCITVETFAEKNKDGRYVVACQNHVVAIVDGDYYDSWNSGNEIVLYFWKYKEE